MALNKKEIKKIATFGAVAGLATPLLLKFVIMPVLNFFGSFIPGISAKLADPAATVSISVTESLTGIEGGLSNWLVNALGLSLEPNLIMTLLLGALGGALFFLAGAYVLDLLNMLKGNAVQKTRAVIFAGSAVAAFVLGGFILPAVEIALIDTIIAFAINAAILAFIYVWIDKKLNLKLLPF